VLQLQAPVGARPIRVAASESLTFGDDERPRHRGVIEEWFEDEAHLDRADAWTVGDGDDVVVVVAEPVVLRGGEWLERRWTDGGLKLKHMALATRADGLTPAQFSAQWRDHAGSARTSTGTAAIPDDVKGLAYVQNHPLPHRVAPYDAVNEVYFDDLDTLQARMAWFRDNGIGRESDELFGSTSFLALREEVVADERGEG
jgi:hypothetical protein